MGAGYVAVLRLIFPPRCAVCDGLLEPREQRRGAHASCEKRLSFVRGPVCMHCGRPVARGEREYCCDCGRRFLQTKSPYRGRRPFSFIRQGKAVFVYEGDIKQTMYRFKYDNRREYASFLADCAFESLGSWLLGGGFLAAVPVPMYWRKQRSRGYNQAELLAEAVAERAHIPCVPHAVSRIRNTRPQKELNDTERENNLKSAFHAADFVVQYKRILLVDDIYTTGSTAEAVAEELCRAGAQEIFVLAACTGKGFEEEI